MARALSDEELQLRKRARRRLIGAVVLVAAAVAVLPMVLDSEPRPREPSVSVQIPSPDSGTFASRIAPLPGGAAGPQAPPAQGPVEPKPASPAAGAAAPGPKSAPAPEPKAAARSPAARPPEKAKGGDYVVQVIALADAHKARELRDRIAAGGLPSYTEVVKTVKGDVTRVRVGPFRTREAAEKARAGLKDMGLGGNVTRR